MGETRLSVWYYGSGEEGAVCADGLCTGCVQGV